MAGSIRSDGRGGGRDRGTLTWWVLGVILVGAAVLYLTGLGEKRLMGDEFMAAEMGRESLAEILRLSFVEVIDPAYSRNRPAFHVLAWATTRLVDDLELSARLPAALGGLVAVWAAFLLGRAAYGAREGLAAAALLAGAQSFVWASTEAVGYAPMVACVTLAFYGAVRAIRASDEAGPGGGAGLRWWVLAGGATALGYYFHPIATLPASGLLLAIVVEGVRSRRWRGLATCFGAGFVVMLPALSNLARLVRWSEGPGGSGRFLDDRGIPPLSLADEGFQEAHTIMKYLGPGTLDGFYVGATLALVGVAASVRRQSFTALTAVLLVVVPVGFVMTVSLGHGWAVRYALFLLVPLALMQARAVVFLADRLPFGRTPCGAVAALLVALLVWSNVDEWKGDGVYIEQDWGGTADFFLENTEGDTLLIASLAGGRLMDVQYNLLNLGRPELIFYFDDELPRFHYTTAGVDSPVRWDFEHPRFRLECAGGVLVLGKAGVDVEARLADHPVRVRTLEGLAVVLPEDTSLHGHVQLAQVLVALVACDPHPLDAQQMMERALDALLRGLEEGASVPDGFLDDVGAYCSGLDPRERADALIALDERLVEIGGTLGVEPRARVGRAHLVRGRELMLSGATETAVDHFLRAAAHGVVTPEIAEAFAGKLRAAGEVAQAERVEAAPVGPKD